MTQNKSDTFFPPYLNAQGANLERSEGPVVYLLQIILRTLQGADFLPPGELVRLSGVYDELTEHTVRMLQHYLGLPTTAAGDEPYADGQFGPATRQLLNKRLSIDVGQIPLSAFQGFSKWTDGKGKLQNWPPSMGI